MGPVNLDDVIVQESKKSNFISCFFKVPFPNLGAEIFRKSREKLRSEFCTKKTSNFAQTFYIKVLPGRNKSGLKEERDTAFLT